jgi:hypothetical protein
VAEALAPSEREAKGVALLVLVGEPLNVGEAVTVGEGEDAGGGVELGVPLPVPVPLGVPGGVADSDTVPEPEGDPEALAPVLSEVEGAVEPEGNIGHASGRPPSLPFLLLLLLFPLTILANGPLFAATRACANGAHRAAACA